MLALLIVVTALVMCTVVSAGCVWGLEQIDPVSHRQLRPADVADLSAEDEVGERIEGAISEQLLNGQLTPEAYRAAMAALALRTEREACRRRHPSAWRG